MTWIGNGRLMYKYVSILTTPKAPAAKESMN